MRLRLMVAAAAGLALLGTGVATAAGPYPPPSKGTGRVDPSHIKAGECAVFSGDGFAPFTTVTITDNGDPAGTATSNANGEFSKQLCYSTDAKKGRHDLAGSGTGSDGQPLTVSAVLIVEGVRQTSGNPSTVSGGQPASGPGSDGSDRGTGSAPGAARPHGGSAAASGSSADQSSGGTVAGSPILPVGGTNSGVRLILLVLTSLGFALAACVALLMLARRRRDNKDAFSAVLA